MTALQIDIKVTGVTAEVLHRALEQARKGRLSRKALFTDVAGGGGRDRRR